MAQRPCSRPAHRGNRTAGTAADWRSNLRQQPRLFLGHGFHAATQHLQVKVRQVCVGLAGHDLAPFSGLSRAVAPVLNQP